MDLLKMALEAANTHEYPICEECSKKNCKNYCLPVEMFVALLNEKDDLNRLEMLENVEYLFKDKEGD